MLVALLARKAVSDWLSSGPLDELSTSVGSRETAAELLTLSPTKGGSLQPGFPNEEWTSRSVIRLVEHRRAPSSQRGGNGPDGGLDLGDTPSVTEGLIQDRTVLRAASFLAPPTR